MKYMTKISCSFMLGCALQGCSAFDWLVYQPDVKQGNQIAQSQLDLLRIAMTKEQVLYVLGTPLMHDLFDANQWYYLSFFKSGLNAEIEQKNIVLTFKDNRLIDIKSDYPLSKNFYIPLTQAPPQSLLSARDPKATLPSR